MEIRDYFAAAALQALVAGVVIKPGGDIHWKVDAYDIAAAAFWIADAMMENRD
jgi:hypothetical protein